MAIAHIAMPIAAWQHFDYWIPEGLFVARGDIVRARLARRKCVGVVTGVDAASDFADRLQPIDALCGIARLPEEMLAMAAFVSTYYQVPPGLAHALLVPPQTRGTRGASKDDAPTQPDALAPGTGHALNAAQASALDALAAGEGKFAVTMLHGVTGRGTTYVYLAAAARAVARG